MRQGRRREALDRVSTIGRGTNGRTLVTSDRMPGTNHWRLEMQYPLTGVDYYSQELAVVADCDCVAAIEDWIARNLVKYMTIYNELREIRYKYRKTRFRARRQPSRTGVHSGDGKKASG